MTDHWTVCQVFSKRAPRLIQEAQKAHCGTFLPTYARVHYRDGKRSESRRHQLPPALRPLAVAVVNTGISWKERATVRLLRLLDETGRAFREDLADGPVVGHSVMLLLGLRETQTQKGTLAKRACCQAELL